MADTLGLTTVYVNRILHQLQQDNLVPLHKHELIILEYDKLTALVGLNLENSEKVNDSGRRVKLIP
ncbi:MAG: winged helix-turn-helix domain-containing protein [Methylococcales bacterium]|nr:winged helix-turn-helix domain-containing protein [Methylococcales bacterium]